MSLLQCGGGGLDLDPLLRGMDFLALVDLVRDTGACVLCGAKKAFVGLCWMGLLAGRPRAPHHEVESVDVDHGIVCWVVLRIFSDS